MPETRGPYDLPELFTEFAFMPHFNSDIDALANIIEPENWEYQNSPPSTTKPILKNFIKYTYKRIAEEKKVSVTQDDAYACWNTGLITTNQEPVFITFSKNNLPNSEQYWHFYKFIRKGEFELNKFSSLPEMAHYFEDPSLLVLDTKKELRVNIEHMISDNISRFPATLQGMSAFGLQNITKGAIDSAIERAKRNYKTAIPQYHKGNIQLLLPLCLTNPAQADLALVAEKYSDFYRASTCLTLDMAYNNARLLARPDRDWLNP